MWSNPRKMYWVENWRCTAIHRKRVFTAMAIAAPAVKAEDFESAVALIVLKMPVQYEFSQGLSVCNQREMI
jgi:hypothetical protein